MPIPGTTTLEHLTDNIGAVAVDLTAKDLGAIEEAFSTLEVVGARYPEEPEEMTDR